LDAVDYLSDGDFYVKVWFGWRDAAGNPREYGKVYSPVFSTNNPNPKPNWQVSWDVPESRELVWICITLYDDDVLLDDTMDISGSTKGLDLYYSIKNGTWWLEDHIGDSNGYGHASGEEDGSTTIDQDDCEIWFNIQQNDYDNDGLTYWEEVNVYGTDPAVDNTGDDLDGDGMSIEWEDWYGLSDLDPGDALDDPDRDGLTNLEEYTVRDLRSDPFYPDLFVEIDYMSGHRPHESVLRYIENYYATHPISSGYSGIHLVFEVDDEIPPNVLDTNNDGFMSSAERRAIKNNPNYWDPDRNGIFRYCIFCDRFAAEADIDPDTMGYAEAPGDDLNIADGACDAYANDWFNHWIGGVTEEQVEKVILMHELGHCINIIDWTWVNGERKEDYCDNTHCVMAKVNWDNCDDKPYYCSHHWAEIDLAAGL